ncbi:MULTISPECIES: helix-turn-helix domain-containing protein [Pseudomonas]|uniref:Helix-turn-helix domain-containing protein n=1 Tax=Pseudomonas urmiensis TaxID=2745493 RepID=A0A923G120_9PSED|nr:MULTISPECIES: helix-turn-helix transcriptional regulator [Pseudomonas]MBV4535653.1 helix-turn-helix domain-containing protein [Pseudomonas urmiensis]HEN8731807.1 helix-turn-helix transcriptional regulator [Pseudomonas putida]
MASSDYLSANLRTLCEKSGSVTEFCRKVGLNRQQFNKYLAGTHEPSKSNLRAIANHFGLSTEVLFSSPGDFRSIIDGSHFHLFRSLIQAPKMISFIDEVTASATPSPSSIIGVYERYHYSSIYTGQIVRSIFCIYEAEGSLRHYYVERFPSADGTGKNDYHFKYHGLCFPVAGRIFAIDFETIQRNELTFSNLASVNRNSKKFIFGVTSGIAASMMRQPVAAKVAMAFVGKGLIRKTHIKRATVLSPTDPSIPKEIITYLDSDNSFIDSARI